MSSRSIRVIRSLQDVPRAQWDALVGPECPFLEWDWLASLEEAGCVDPRRGWAPHHIVVEQDDQLVAACPMYLKGHSEGEFVFDYEWAFAAESAGVDYYPKMLVAIPFTPATGARFLTAAGHDRTELIQLMGQVLMEVCEQNELSSVHVNFCRPDEVEALGALGFLERVGVQYHWHNHGYETFDDYLAEFKSKRRTKIRRELKEMDAAAITIRALRGDAIPDALLPTMYDLYRHHIEKLYWGRLYLNRRFFDLLGERFRRNLCFVVAEHEGEVIAGTVNVQKNGVFYGRYWGAFEERHHLHFNVCYYAAIRHCIEDGVQTFEPGAGGDFKRLRGFDPQPTRSMHYLRHPGLREAVEDHLERERARMGMLIERMTADSKLRVTRQRMAGQDFHLDLDL